MHMHYLLHHLAATKTPPPEMVKAWLKKDGGGKGGRCSVM